MSRSYPDLYTLSNAHLDQNKWEHVSERELDLVIDHLNTLNHLTPKIKCQDRNVIDPKFIFGLDTKLFLDPIGAESQDAAHHEEVETIMLYRGPLSGRPNHGHGHHHHDAALSSARDVDEHDSIGRVALTDSLNGLSKESVWRVKGFVRLADGVHILNWAFGRFDLTKRYGEADKGEGSVRLTVMGERGEVKRASRKFAAALGADIL